MDFQSIFFDLDGTLTDSAPGITNAIIYARKKWGLPTGPPADYYKFIGPPMPQSFQDYWGFSRPDAERFLADYREYFMEKGLFENSVYDGIPALLQSLKDQGRRLFIATTKPTESSLRIAERFGLTPYFELISGSNPERDNTKADVIAYARDRCQVDMSSAVMVGDRRHDVEGARACGIDCIGVTYGFGSRQELEEAGAKWIADSIFSLAALLLT